jgi:hypothetical protein
MSERVRTAIRKLAQGRPGIFTGQAYDVGTDTCTVIPSDGGPPYYDVRLKPHPEAPAFQIPAEGSEVVCAQMGEQAIVVVMVADPERVVIEVGDSMMIESEQASVLIDSEINLRAGAELRLASSGASLQAGGQSLKQILSDLLTTLKTLAPLSTTPGNPTAPNPADIAKLQALETRLNLLLNG